MSWFGDFTLGAGSGLVASAMIAAGVVYVFENGTDAITTAVLGNTETNVEASSFVDGFLDQVSWGVKGEELHPPIEPALHDGLYMKMQGLGVLGIVEGSDDDIPEVEDLATIVKFLEGVMPTESVMSLSQGMRTVELQDGETPEQAMNRALNRFNPEFLAAAMTRGNAIGMGMMSALTQQSCDPSRGAEMSDQQRMLWQAECANMSRAAQGRFPFGINDMNNEDIDMMAAMNGLSRVELEKQCDGPPPADMIELKRILREKICVQVREAVVARVERGEEPPEERSATDIQVDAFVDMLGGPPGSGRENVYSSEVDWTAMKDRCRALLAEEMPDHDRNVVQSFCDRINKL